MQEKEILDNAPESATHVDEEGDYCRASEESGYTWEYLCTNQNTWLDYGIAVGLRSLADIKRIAELENQWISVDDRLPPGCSGNYLTYRPSSPADSRVSSTWYDPNHNGWSGKYTVTHWMPLTAPPRKLLCKKKT